MKLVIKLTLANIFKNKLRTFMIVLSVLLSTALIYAIMSISGSVEDVFEKQMRKESGTAEIFISNASQPTKGLKENFEDSGHFEYAKGIIQCYGYETQLKDEDLRVDLHGYTLDDLKSIHNIHLAQTHSESFVGSKAILGQETVNAYGLSVGDELVISINGQSLTVTVWAVASDENNLLAKEPERFNVILPLSYLQEQLNLNENSTVYFLKTKSSISLDDAKLYLEEAYPQYQVQSLDMDSIKSMMNMITVPLLILVLVVVIISVFIIYSAFKVISIERLPFIGTLRSIGSTRVSTSLTLLFESFIYGIIGGILGAGLGAIIVYIFTVGMPGGNGSEAQLSYNLLNMVIAVIFALVLSLISALKPITKTLHISIKDIITNTVQNSEELRAKKAIIGLACILLAFVLFNWAPKSIALPLTFFGVILLPVGVTFIIPLLIKALTLVFGWIEKMLPSSGAKLALSNIQHDKTLHNNIVLMSIGLGIILLVNTLVYSIMVEVVDVYGHASYDIMLVKSYEDPDFDSEISEIEGVSSTYKNYEKRDVKVKNKDFTIRFLNSFDKEFSDKAWHIELGTNKEKALEGIQNQRGIIISATLANKNDLKVGDILELELDETTQTYTITGIADSILNNGQMAFISKENLKRDVTKDMSVTYYLETSLPAVEVKNTIKKKYSSEEFFITTLQELKENNIKNNNAIFMMMKGISIIAMLIGIIGIFNNYVISYISRKRNLSVMRSIGLENVKMVRMLLLESFLCGFMGAIIGVVSGILFMYSLKYVFILINMPAILHFSWPEILITLVSGILISLLAAAAPVLKINKMSIVQNLKYE